MMHDELEWVDELPGHSPRSNMSWAVIKAQLKTRPGIWAHVATDVGTGTAQNFKNSGFEAACRNVKNNRCDLYARWPE